MEPEDRLIVALDVPALPEAQDLLHKLGPRIRWVKVGLELFVREGRELLRHLKQRYRIMLDLKLHDIPETVGRTVANVKQHADLITVHTSGGLEMLQAAVKAAGQDAGILGVTVLTSLNDQKAAQAGLMIPVHTTVFIRARLARDAGCAGIVCSPLEAGFMRDNITCVTPGFLLVTPGIRPAGAETHDQLRVATPSQAIKDGATHLVVGRPLRDNPSPETVDALLKEMTP